jgi:hypothetical protein
MLGATTNLRGRSTHTNEPLQSNHRAKATEATLFPTDYSALEVGASSLCRRCRLIAVAADRRQRARLTDSHRASTKPTRAFATQLGKTSARQAQLPHQATPAAERLRATPSALEAPKVPILDKRQGNLERDHGETMSLRCAAQALAAARTSVVAQARSARGQKRRRRGATAHKMEYGEWPPNLLRHARASPRRAAALAPRHTVRSRRRLLRPQLRRLS